VLLFLHHYASIGMVCVTWPDLQTVFRFLWCWPVIICALGCAKPGMPAATVRPSFIQQLHCMHYLWPSVMVLLDLA
jgi:hypothetical protein